MNPTLHILKLRHVPQRLMTLRYLVTHPSANTCLRPTPHLTFLIDIILRMALNGKHYGPILQIPILRLRGLKDILRSTQLVSGQTRKCLTACPHASCHPASPLHKHPASSVAGSPHTHTSSPPHSSDPRKTRGTSRTQANEDLGQFSEWLNPSPLHPLLSPRILVRRDTWRWKPLVKLIERPSKLDEWVLHSPEHQALRLGLASAPLPHGVSVPSASCPPSAPGLGVPLNPLTPAEQERERARPVLLSPSTLTSCLCFL